MSIRMKIEFATSLRRAGAFSTFATAGGGHDMKTQRVTAPMRNVIRPKRADGADARILIDDRIVCTGE